MNPDLVDVHEQLDDVAAARMARLRVRDVTNWLLTLLPDIVPALDDAVAADRRYEQAMVLIDAEWGGDEYSGALRDVVSRIEASMEVMFGETGQDGWYQKQLRERYAGTIANGQTRVDLDYDLEQARDRLDDHRLLVRMMRNMLAEVDKIPDQLASPAAQFMAAAIDATRKADR